MVTIDTIAPPTPAWSPLKFHEKQHRAFTATEKRVFLVAGRGSGKTEIFKRRLVLSLPSPKPWPDPRYFYAADTTPHAKDIAWDSLISLIPAWWIKGQPVRSRGLIETIFGSSLTVFGVHDGGRRSLPVEGKQWDGGGVDERSDCAPGVVETAILPALTHRDGWLWELGVPKRHGVGANEFRRQHEEASRGEIPGAIGLTWPSSDILPPERLAAAKRSMDPKTYREQFEASWETAGGGVFYAFSEANIRPCPYRDNEPIVVGCDFNVDPMAWVIGHRIADRFEWFDELWMRDANTPGALDLLWGRYSHHAGGFEFYGDASGKNRHSSANFSDYALIHQDRRFERSPGGRRVFFPDSNPGVEDRFAACNSLFLNAVGERRMFVDRRCQRLIDDLKSRVRAAPGVKLPADMGHITDAMGYPVHYLSPVGVTVIANAPRVIISRGR